MSDDDLHTHPETEGHACDVARYMLANAGKPPRVAITPAEIDVALAAERAAGVPQTWDEAMQIIKQLTFERDSEARWAKHYHDRWQAALATIDRLRRVLET